MRSQYVLLSLGLLAGGCVVEDKLPGDGTGDMTGSADETGGSGGDGTTTPTGLNVALVLLDQDGGRMPRDTFDARDQVYFSLEAADAAKPVVAEDYAFQIVGNDGALRSNDAFACRLFHVNARGMIDSVQSAGGSDCEHELRRGGDGRILVKAMPFEVPQTNGNSPAKLTVKIATLATCRGDNEFGAGIGAPFEIESSDGDGKD